MIQARVTCSPRPRSDSFPSCIDRSADLPRRGGEVLSGPCSLSSATLQHQQHVHQQEAPQQKIRETDLHLLNIGRTANAWRVLTRNCASQFRGSRLVPAGPFAISHWRAAASSSVTSLADIASSLSIPNGGPAVPCVPPRLLSAAAVLDQLALHALKVELDFRQQLSWTQRRTPTSNREVSAFVTCSPLPRLSPASRFIERSLDRPRR